MHLNIPLACLLVCLETWRVCLSIASEKNSCKDCQWISIRGLHLAKSSAFLPLFSVFPAAKGAPFELPSILNKAEAHLSSTSRVAFVLAMFCGNHGSLVTMEEFCRICYHGRNSDEKPATPNSETTKKR